MANAKTGFARVADSVRDWRSERWLVLVIAVLGAGVLYGLFLYGQRMRAIAPRTNFSRQSQTRIAHSARSSACASACPNLSRAARRFGSFDKSKSTATGRPRRAFLFRPS